MTETDHSPLIDAHAHLQDPKLLPQLNHILDLAQQHHLTAILVNATSPQDWRQVEQLSDTIPICYAALGLHPFCVSQWTPELITLLKQHILTTPNTKIVAIGEIGLDAWNGRDSLPLQLKALEAQLLLALELNLPVCLHIRKAWNDFFQLIQHLKIKRLRGLCHNFTGSTEILRQLLNLGLMVSYAGPAANPNAHKIHQSIIQTPLEAMLVETDAPNMPCKQVNSTVSLPHHTHVILETIARLKQLPMNTLATKLQQNFSALIQKNETTNEASCMDEPDAPE